MRKLQEQDDRKDDEDSLPIEKMRDGPKKLKKMLEAFKGTFLFSDPVFKA